jgi:fibronectin-binding autotransporter adhesin
VNSTGAFTSGGTLTLDSGGSLVGGSITAAAYQLNAGKANANLSGPGGLTKDTGGKVVLSGSNSYAGGTVVKAGTLIAGNANALPNGTSLTVGAGGVFVFDPSQSASGAVAAAIPAVAAASTASSPIVVAIAPATIPVATLAVSRAIPATPGIAAVTPAGKANSATTAAGNAGQQASAATRPAAMSSAPVDAVFMFDRSAFDRVATSAKVPQAVSAWGWLAAIESSANSSDQKQKTEWTAGAVDKVLAEYGL